MKVIMIFFVALSLNLYAKANWHQVYDKDGVLVYADRNAKGIIPFKAVAYIDHNIEKVVEVLIDNTKKHLWAPKLKSVKIHKKMNKENMIFSEYYSTPWPATDREFLLHGKVIRRKDYYLLTAKTIHDSKLMDKNHIQAEVKKLELVLEKTSKNKTKVTFEFYGDMKGWMPTWLINLIQKRWPYLFIKRLQKQIVLVNK
jgi:hypothetical protein